MDSRNETAGSRGRRIWFSVRSVYGVFTSAMDGPFVGQHVSTTWAPRAKLHSGAAEQELQRRDSYSRELNALNVHDSIEASPGAVEADTATPELGSEKTCSEKGTCDEKPVDHLLTDAEYARRLHDAQRAIGEDRLFAESVARSQEMTPDTGGDADLMRRTVALDLVDTTACPICMETFSSSMAVALGDCKHQFCTSCVYSYLDMAGKERTSFPIPCPECRGDLHPLRCLAALAGTGRAFAALEKYIIEKMHMSQLRYCPNEKCAQVFDWSDNPCLEGSATRYRAMCSACSTAFCVECKIPWHEGKSCVTSKEERAGDKSLQALAQLKHWKPCPSCGELIEKVSGCLYMKCRCGCGFCYKCGEAYVDRRGAPRNVHGTPPCKCGL